MAISLEVPSWLVPPSQAEQRRLALLEDQVKSKAVTMLRKQVGLAKMKSEAEELKSGGLDELTARKTALLNNADLLFADNPEAIARLQHNEEAQAIRTRAQEQTLEYRNRMASVAEQRLAEIAAHNLELEDARRKKLISDDEYRRAQQELKLKDQEINLMKTEADISHRKALEKATQENSDIRREANQIKRTKLAEDDQQLRMMEMQLKSAESQLEAGEGRFERHSSFLTRKADLEKKRDDLKSKIDQRRKMLTGEDSSAPAPTAPAPGKVLRYDPKLKKLVE